jgi:hypothetical protein
MTKSQRDSYLGCGVPIFFVLFCLFLTDPTLQFFLPGLIGAVLKAGVCTLVLLFIASILINLVRDDDQGILAEIEERKKEALDKNIFMMASKVLLQWGKLVGCELQLVSGEMEIVATVIEGEQHKIIINYKRRGVFECISGIEKGISYGEPLVKLQRISDGFELVEEYGASDKAVIKINSYIPGRWVKVLEVLGQRVDRERVENQRAKERQHTKEIVEGERGKFGL